VGLVLGVDGGNSKTDVVVATTGGEPVSYVRGGGSSAHGKEWHAGAIATIASLVDLDEHAERAVLFLAGADLPHDIEELTARAQAQEWARTVLVENDVFALLHAGTDRDDAIGVVCGSGINCIGRRKDGLVSRYPGLGWETGDWGGSESFARWALYLANRGADGRAEQTALVDLFESHFGKPVVEIGADVHYRRMDQARLAEVTPAIVDAADPVARRLTSRLADEIVRLVERALRDLELDDCDTVLGGGMLAKRTRLYELVAPRVPNPVVPELPPVAGSVLAALDAEAQQRFRTAFDGWTPSAG
jgi:N-acetylglucosamine kinase-like BadF-type ATPase